jgi:hypothetical protein
MSVRLCRLLREFTRFGLAIGYFRGGRGEEGRGKRWWEGTGGGRVTLLGTYLPDALLCGYVA